MKQKKTDTELIYEFILNNINEGIHVVDANGNTIMYNQKIAELESMQKDEVLNRHFLEVFHFAEGQSSNILQALKGQRTTYLKQTYFNDKGKQITTINKSLPIIEDGRIIGAIEIANDVTKMERIMQDNISRRGKTHFTFESIIGESEAIKKVIEIAQKASRTSSAVLIIGETGTGKELFAQSIHTASSRSAQPFISQNCAAIPDSLIESILFGTVKGAFTGAIDRPGLFEQAEGGTLMLDEINSLSPTLQSKFLRVLQERTFRQVGDTKDKTVDVRVISTMNEEPMDAIANNHLREDLYYRLGVVTMCIPPLRERKEDILLLADHFIQKYNRLFHMNVRRLSNEVKQFVMSYDWPGNVRELENIIEGAMNQVENEDEIHYSHLPLNSLLRNARKRKGVTPQDRADTEAGSGEWNARKERTCELRHQMEEAEKNVMMKIINNNGGNLSRAAKDLGISRQSLQYRLRKYHIESMQLRNSAK